MERSEADRSTHHWVAVWASMSQETEESNMPPPPFKEPGCIFRDTTLRQTVRVSTGGEKLRIRISNAFGRTNLGITAATIALPRAERGKPIAGSRAILHESLKILTFGGLPGAEIPNGAIAISDVVDFPVHRGQVVTLSIYLRDGQAGGEITSHPGSRTESWMCRGNSTRSDDLLGSPDLASLFHWYFIAGIDAWQPSSCCAAVLLGDSITDGRCSTDNYNNRWPDLLSNRMIERRHHPLSVSLVNQAAGGNRVLTDGLGPNLLGRLDRDVFAQPGARFVVLFHGVNDIGTAAPDVASQKAIQERLIWGYKQVAARVHTLGLLIVASTIAPFSAPDGAGQAYSAATREATRQRVNSWIRSTEVFDAVVDFDRVLRDPEDATRLHPAYDSGDYLHPNVQGFQAIANAFPLDLFDRLRPRKNFLG